MRRKRVGQEDGLPDAGNGAAQAPLARILIGFVALWLVLDQSARVLGSFSGEAGLLVCALTLLAAAAVETALFGRSAGGSLRSLGMRRPRRKCMLFAALLAAGLMAFYPLFSRIASPVGAVDGWPLLAAGLFAQGGIAEETVFRGYLFRHLREGRGFWPAALLAALPFAAVHALLFLSLDFPVALAGLALSVSLSFPFARLFECAGNSIWPSALLHFVIQGSIKLVVVSDAWFMPMALAWMLLAGAAPWLVFLLRDDSASGRRPLYRAVANGVPAPR